MALNDRQQKVIELYAEGETVTNIAKICGVSRQTIYTDLDNNDVKAGIDNCITEMKTQAEKKLGSKIDNYVSELEKIALTSKSEKNKLDALQYILNRIYGTPTSKVADVTDKEDKKDDFINLDNIVEDIDNVVKLDKKKAK